MSAALPTMGDCRTVTGLRKLYSPLDRLGIDPSTSDLVDHLDCVVDFRVLVHPAAPRLHLEATHPLAFLAQDGDHVHRCAPCHPEQQETQGLGAGIRTAEAFRGVGIDAETRRYPRRIASRLPG